MDALELSGRVAEWMTSFHSGRLPDRLGELARLVAGCPQADGTLIVALDEKGFPSSFGSCGVEWGSEPPSCQDVKSLLERTEGQPDGNGFWALRLGGPVPLGAVLLKGPAGCSTEAMRVVADASSILAAAIQFAVRAEEWQLREELEDLVRQIFREPECDLRQVVDRLSVLFRADAVTILLEDGGELRLAASTDLELGKREPVVYKPGEGLTGWVFKHRSVLLLNDTKDRVEIKRKTGQDRKGPRHPEHDPKGERTHRFLAVPMLLSGRAVGVIRMSRSSSAALFTPQDEKVLQFFAGLLGGALKPSWDLLWLWLTSIFESSTEAIAVSKDEVNEDGSVVPRIITVNEGGKKLLGRMQSDIAGVDARDLYAPGEYDRIRWRLRRTFVEARKKGRSEYGPVTSRIQKPDRSLIPVSISYRVLANKRVNPPSFYAIALARDTSESERHIQRHRRILEFLDVVDVAYFQADQNGLTLESTPAESRILGYPPKDLDGLNREKLYSDPRQRRELIEQARRNDGRLTQTVQPMIRQDGSPILVEGDLRIVKDPTTGNEMGLEGFYRNVTERIRLQGFLNETTKRVLGDNELFPRLKKDAEFHLNYLTSLGHQLQTPLGSLLQTLRNFERGIVTERRLAERLPYVIGQAVVCIRLVRNLSYMDKILRGEKFHQERVSLTKLTKETAIDFDHLLKEKGIELKIESESLDRYLRVQGHPEMLRQVIVNLVDNAIKYSIPGTTIHIRGRYWPRGPAFEISNHGLIIPPEERESIFERGFRSWQAKAWIPGGTGFGLWLVRKIVEAHGATIRCHEIYEDWQRRTLFRITFPHLNVRRHP